MLFLLDTNAFSDLMANVPRIAARVASAAPADRVVTCTIVRGEILFGIERIATGRRPQSFQTNAALLFTRIACEPVSPAVDDVYARIKQDRRARGLVMDENDLWIAATALSLGAVLVTRDSDFRHVNGLTVEDWTI